MKLRRLPPRLIPWVTFFFFEATVLTEGGGFPLTELALGGVTGGDTLC